MKEAKRQKAENKACGQNFHFISPWSSNTKPILRLSVVSITDTSLPVSGPAFGRIQSLGKS
jgi:hypothetical protein